jgi:hypothetical protein
MWVQCLVQNGYSRHLDGSAYYLEWMTRRIPSSEIQTLSHNITGLHLGQGLIRKAYLQFSSSIRPPCSVNDDRTFGHSPSLAHLDVRSVEPRIG